jgi:hypothetical protein
MLLARQHLWRRDAVDVFFGFVGISQAHLIQGKNHVFIPEKGENNKPNGKIHGNSPSPVSCEEKPNGKK